MIIICARSLNLAIRISGVCPTKNPSWWMRRSQRFWDTNRSPNLGQTTRPSNSQQKKKKREPTVKWTLPFQRTTESN